MKNINLMPNPQPGGPWYRSLSGASFRNCPARVTLPAAILPLAKLLSSLSHKSSLTLHQGEDTIKGDLTVAARVLQTSQPYSRSKELLHQHTVQYRCSKLRPIKQSLTPELQTSAYTITVKCLFGSKHF